MRAFLIMIFLIIGSQLTAQKLEFNKEYVLNKKVFKTSEKIRSDGLTLNNAKNINLQEGYELYVLINTTYDRFKLSDILLNTFSKERIDELKLTSNNSNPAFGMTWHLNQEGTICSITFRFLRSENQIKLEEFSQLEDQLKEEIVVTDFLTEDNKGRNYYSLTLFVNLSKVLDGSFVR